MNRPLLDAYKQGTKEYKIASDNYEYGYQQGKKAVKSKISDLEQKYKKVYGCEIIEMYSDIIQDLKEWLI